MKLKMEASFIQSVKQYRRIRLSKTTYQRAWELHKFAPVPVREASFPYQGIIATCVSALAVGMHAPQCVKTLKRKGVILLSLSSS